MAAGTAAVDNNTTSNHHQPNILHADSVAIVDLRSLSQSELHTLSLFSSSSSSSSSSSLSSLQHLLVNDTDTDVDTTLKIDRAVFNESAGSRKQTFSRLRLAAAPNSPPIPTPLLEQQYLGEENSQIISILNSLFANDPHSNFNHLLNDNNLISVPIQYNEHLFLRKLPSAISNSLGAQINHAIPTVITNADSFGLKKRKRGRPRKHSNNNNNNNNNNNSNQIVIESNKREKEMVMLNKNGFAVDLVALGNLENPYGAELRRRTEGVRTEAELLGFLQGLEGQWGSRRKKRKVVDANLFGDVLPVGWKLMLCLKKKAGHVWLSCRRYISPNGHQFVSCKEVSSYLLSFSGLQDGCQLNFGHTDGSFQLTNKITTENAAGLSLQNDKKGDDLIFCSALPITSKSTEHEKPASSLKIGSPGNLIVGKEYKCHKCTMAFDEPDDLLQHLLSIHQRPPKRLQCASSISEEVIIKNGKYECQFCHKPFEERHRYNGHLGIHIKDYVKRLEASSGVTTTQKSIAPASVGVPPDGLKFQESVGIDGDPVAITSCSKTNSEVSSAVCYCQIKANNHETYCGEQGRICSIINDKAEKMSRVIADVTADVNIGSSAQSTLLNNAKSTIGTNTVCRQEKSSQNSSFAADGRDRACVVDNNVNQVLTSFMAEHSQERGFETGLPAPNTEEKALRDENIEKISSTMEAIETDDRDLAGKEKLIAGFGNCCTAQEDVTAIKKQRSEASVVPSGSDQRNGFVNNVNKLLTSIDVEIMQERCSKGGLLSSIDDQMCKVSNGTIEVPKHDEVVSCSKNSVFSCDADLVAGSLTNNELGKSSNNFLVVQSADEQTFALKDYGVGHGIMEKLTLDRNSESSLHRLSCDLQTPDDKNNVNQLSCGIMEEHKHNKAKSDGNNGGLGIALDCGPYEKDANAAASSVQESFSKGYSLVVHRNEQTFAPKDTVFRLYCGTVDKLKPGRGSVETLLCLAGSEQVQNVENNLNRAFAGTSQEDVRLEDFENPRKNELVISENAVSEYMRRTVGEDDLLSGFARSATRQVQSSGCFPTYDLISDKNESELFGEKFDSLPGSEGQRLGNMGNMEYNFLTSKMGSHSGESKVLSYEAEMAQGFDSSVWLEKEALPLLPKMTSRGHISTVCICCRNEFHHETFESEAQTSSMSFTCAVCKAGGQVNLL